MIDLVLLHAALSAATWGVCAGLGITGTTCAAPDTLGADGRDPDPASLICAVQSCRAVFGAGFGQADPGSSCSVLGSAEPRAGWA